ncbi:MAG: DUF169 domain-containing protein [Actinomycetota bacterium]
MNKEDIKVLDDILDLARNTVMVKFLKTEDDINFQNFDNPKVRFCQALNLAQTGKDILLGKENISCPAAAAAFGFKKLPPILSSGNMLYNMGLFKDPQTGRKMMEQVPRLELGRFHKVALTSNLDAGDPHVIIIETHPENIMWMLLASIYKSGERLSLSTGVFQAACVDSAVIPFKTGRVNACWGCYGCRDATDIGKNEGLIGIPAGSFSQMVKNLSALETKPIKNARKKMAFSAIGKLLGK